MGTRLIAYLTLIVSVFYYRSGDTLKNSIVLPPPLPAGYVAGGDYSSDCTTFNEEHLKFCEDIAFWDLQDKSGKLEDRRVLLSCDPGRKQWNTVMGPLNDPAPRGALWIYTPTKDKTPNTIADIRAAKPGTRPQRITFKNFPIGHDFHPLGLDIYPSRAGGASNLYVVNHARARTVIEHFVLSPSDPTTATHIRTISSPYFLSPNALALTSPDSFYVTNDHLITRRLPVVGRFLPLTETLLGLPFAFVSHVTLAQPSATSNAILDHTFSSLFIPFPNGIAISSSGKLAALASTSLSKIIFYNRDPATNALTRADTIPVPFVPDNIRFNEDDELIVTGHPNFPNLVKVAADKPGALAPSWVVSIKASDGKRGDVYDLGAPVTTHSMISLQPKWTIQTLFQSNGTAFSSSSTGLKDPLTNTLYVSGLYAEQGVLVCKL